MQRTRWIGAGLLASALALTSCTSSPAGVDAKQDAKAELELWTRTTPGGPGEKATLRLVAGFEKATGHKVKVTAIFDDFETKLQQRAAQRNRMRPVRRRSARLRLTCPASVKGAASGWGSGGRARSILCGGTFAE